MRCGIKGRDPAPAPRAANITEFLRRSNEHRDAFDRPSLGQRSHFDVRNDKEFREEVPVFHQDLMESLIRGREYDRRVQRLPEFSGTSQWLNCLVHFSAYVQQGRNIAFDVGLVPTFRDDGPVLQVNRRVGKSSDLTFS